MTKPFRHHPHKNLLTAFLVLDLILLIGFIGFFGMKVKNNEVRVNASSSSFDAAEFLTTIEGHQQQVENQLLSGIQQSSETVDTAEGTLNTFSESNSLPTFSYPSSWHVTQSQVNINNIPQDILYINDQTISICDGCETNYLASIISVEKASLDLPAWIQYKDLILEEYKNEQMQELVYQESQKENGVLIRYQGMDTVNNTEIDLIIFETDTLAIMTVYKTTMDSSEYDETWEAIVDSLNFDDII